MSSRARNEDRKLQAAAPPASEVSEDQAQAAAPPVSEVSEDQAQAAAPPVSEVSEDQAQAAAPPVSEVSEDQARFSQLIADAAAKPDDDASLYPTEYSNVSHLGTVPTVGRVVIYHSKKGDGIVSPAMVLRTRQSTNLDVIERWGDKPDNTVSGVKRPDELVAELPDDTTVDLLVHGLGGDYREYAVPFADLAPTPEDAEHTPGTWSWPPRV